MNLANTLAVKALYLAALGALATAESGAVSGESRHSSTSLSDLRPPLVLAVAGFGRNGTPPRAGRP